VSRSARLLVALASAFLLVGCATVPTSGPVERQTSQATGVNSGVHVDPLPPAEGASQLLVVEGFLHAMSVYQPDYAIARQYLTESASKNWHPESGVQIYADGFPPTDTGSNVVLSGVPVTGFVDATGSYRPVTGTTQTFNFNLIKDAGDQWRISSPPQGLLVSRYVFTTNFTAVNLYFTDPSGTSLVPDPRFFATGDQAMVAAVTQLLTGPSSWLAPAVRKLDTSGITIGGVVLDPAGLVDVALGGATDRLSADQRHTLLAELAYTMTDFDAVGSVRVTGAAQVWRDQVGQSVVRPESFAALSPEGAGSRVLFLVHDHKLKRLRDATDWDNFLTVDAGITKPEQIAVNTDLSQVAAVTDGGTTLELGQTASGKAARSIRTGAGLLRPAFARNGELWSPAPGGPGELQVFKGEQRLKVTVSGLPDARVRALALSADGTRVAFILRQGRTDVVGLARVERSDGAITVDGWRTVDLALNTSSSALFLDLGWLSPTELGVLVSSNGDTSVVRASQDGATANDIGPSEASALEQLAVAPAAGSPAVALGSSGSVYRFDGDFNWNLAITSVDAVAYSG